jgi:chromosome segregation ATPase
MLATRRLENELKETKKKVSQLESLVEVLQSQFKHHSQSNEKRTDLFSKAISELERELREHQLVQNRQNQKMEEKLKQNRINDGQVESLIERFNNNLAQFETKISVLQKALSEKQMTLMSYRSIIEQIVDEVEKIKGKI